MNIAQMPKNIFIPVEIFWENTYRVRTIVEQQQKSPFSFTKPHRHEYMDQAVTHVHRIPGTP